MKTVEEIKKDILEIEEKYAKAPKHETESKEGKKDGRQLRRLTELLYYLETNPDERTVKNQSILLNHKLKKIMDGFPAWVANVCDPKVANKMAAYKSLMEVKKIKNQITNLKYLLK